MMNTLYSTYKEQGTKSKINATRASQLRDSTKKFVAKPKFINRLYAFDHKVESKGKHQSSTIALNKTKEDQCLDQIYFEYSQGRIQDAGEAAR